MSFLARVPQRPVGQNEDRPGVNVEDTESGGVEGKREGSGPSNFLAPKVDVKSPGGFYEEPEPALSYGHLDHTHWRGLGGRHPENVNPQMHDQLSVLAGETRFNPAFEEKPRDLKAYFDNHRHALNTLGGFYSRATPEDLSFLRAQAEASINQSLKRIGGRWLPWTPDAKAALELKDIIDAVEKKRGEHLRRYGPPSDDI